MRMQEYAVHADYMHMHIRRIIWQRKEALKSALLLSSDENQLKIRNLSDAAKKPATNVMSLWPWMMVACNAFPEK